MSEEKGYYQKRTEELYDFWELYWLVRDYCKIIFDIENRPGRVSDEDRQQAHKEIAEFLNVSPDSLNGVLHNLDNYVDNKAKYNIPIIVRTLRNLKDKDLL